MRPLIILKSILSLKDYFEKTAPAVRMMDEKKKNLRDVQTETIGYSDQGIHGDGEGQFFAGVAGYFRFGGPPGRQDQRASRIAVRYALVLVSCKSGTTEVLGFGALYFKY